MLGLEVGEEKFSLTYHDYKLSKGEWILLKYVTDLILKILEQSLIIKFKPKLNTIQHVGIRPWYWRDSYLDEITSEKSLYKVYGKADKYLIKIPISKERYMKIKGFDWEFLVTKITSKTVKILCGYPSSYNGLFNKKNIT